MVKIEKIETLYSPGTAEHLEDGNFVNLPFFGVVDGCSALYWPGNPPILFNGFTGGQLARNLILKTFISAWPEVNLEDVVKQANEKIARMQIIKKNSLDNAGKLISTSFVLGKIKETRVEIIQGGDCYALWVTKSGKIEITKNQAYEPEVVLVKNFARLIKKYKGDRAKAWKEHGPFLAKMRKENANKTYADLNGQPIVEKCWQKIEIPLSDLFYLICFSDGLIPFSAMKNEKDLAKKILMYFIDERLSSVLNWTRKVEKREAKHSYEDHAEASGLAIKFK